MQRELLQMAVMLPREDIYNMYLDKCKVEDYNGDGMPEVYLAAGSGWQYWVCYYLDGEMRTVEDLEPWAWSSDLCITEDGHLVLYTWAHTMGTEGTTQHRIYAWTSEGYRGITVLIIVKMVNPSNKYPRKERKILILSSHHVTLRIPSAISCMVSL